MKKKTKIANYFINGMHCASCKLIIEKELTGIKGVRSAKVLQSEKRVVIESSHDLGLADYNKVLTKSGYNLGGEEVKTSVWDLNNLLRATVVFAILFGFYLIFGLQNKLANFSVSQNASLTAFFVFGLVAGVSTCAALTGGLLLTLSGKWQQQFGAKTTLLRATPFILFNLGRLLAFVILGGLLGLVGSFFQLSVGLSAILVLAVSLFMVITGLQTLEMPYLSRLRLQLPNSITRKLSSSESFTGKYMPFLAGAGTFFLPCGFTLIAQAVALTTGSFRTSALMMAMFALGTLLPLIVISYSSLKLQSNKTFAGTFNLVVGLVIVFFGLYNINSQLVVLNWPNFNSLVAKAKAKPDQKQVVDELGLGVKTVTENGTKKQYVLMKAVGFEYLPTLIRLIPGIDTTLTIKTDNVVGCAQAMYMRGLYEEVVYLNKPEVTVNFIPKPGTYSISCTMGMVKPVTVIVE